MREDETNQRLLQLTAKAIGLPGEVGPYGMIASRRRGHAVVSGQWNPLADLDDAIDVANELMLTISFGYGSVTASKGDYVNVASKDPDPIRATCRAIVQAAAFLGKQHPHKIP